jgi:hypothetical protein
MVSPWVTPSVSFDRWRPAGDLQWGVVVHGDGPPVSVDGLVGQWAAMWAAPLGAWFADDLDRVVAQAAAEPLPPGALRNRRMALVTATCDRPEGGWPAPTIAEYLNGVRRS